MNKRYKVLIRKQNVFANKGYTQLYQLFVPVDPLIQEKYKKSSNSKVGLVDTRSQTHLSENGALSSKKFERSVILLDFSLV